MMPEKRRQEIVRLNQEKNGVSIKELAEFFSVSSMTILRDIRILEKRNSLEIVRGGVVPLSSFNSEANSFKNIYDSKKRQSFIEKNEIAEFCAHNFITEGQIIAIEGGSTASSIIKYLSNKKKITVITNGVFAMEEAYKKLQTSSRIIGTGGLLERPYLLFLGPDSERFFEDKSIDIAFFSCVAMDLKNGPMDSNPSEVRFKQSMIKSAERRVLIVDKNKLGLKSLMSVIELKEITDIVTNKNIDKELIKKLEQLGPKVHLI